MLTHGKIHLRFTQCLRERGRQESPQGILLAPLPQTPAAVPEIPRKVQAARRHPILWLALSWSQPEKRVESLAGQPAEVLEICDKFCLGFAILTKVWLYLFLFVSSLLEAEGLPKKEICVSLFVERLFFEQVLCTIIVYLVGVEVVGVLVE